MLFPTMVLMLFMGLTCCDTALYAQEAPQFMVLPGDWDSDGILDEFDIDDDNDGIPDDIEDLKFDSRGGALACTHPALNLENPVLESGSDLTVGAVYRYTNVLAGVDMLLTIVAIDNCSINELDQSSDGFLDAFQPKIDYNTTGVPGVEFNFVFVDAGTSTPTPLIERIGGTTYDVDGDTDDQESFVFYDPSVYALDETTTLTTTIVPGGVEISADGTAEGGGIDPDPQYRAYFQYKETNSFNFRVQYLKTSSGSTTRLYCIRFDECFLADLNNVQMVIIDGLDTDGDGVPDYRDLDSDNDGIYDCVESGSDQAHTNGVLDGAVTTNGLPVSVDLDDDHVIDYVLADNNGDLDHDSVDWDSDSDGCPDVLEGAFSDDDADGYLGDSPVTVDAFGVVTSASDGYTTPKDDNSNGTYDFREVSTFTITCPANVTANNNPGTCIGTVTVDAPTFTGTCGSVTFTNDYNGTSDASDNYPVGVTTVNWTATDEEGNVQTCSNTVTISDVDIPSIVCGGDLTVSVDGACEFDIPDYTGFVIASDNCDSDLTMTQTPVIGTVISGAGTVQTIEVTATDDAGNSNSCTFNVTLEDNTAPALTCPGDIDEEIDPTCDFTIPDYTGLTAVVENCPGVITYTQTPSSGTVISGLGTVQTISIVATDPSGNSDSCQFDITLVPGPDVYAGDFYIETEETSASCKRAVYPASFTDLENVSINGNDLEKTGGSDAGAFSYNAVYNHGYAYTIVNELDTERHFGLSETNTDASETTIEYAFRMHNDHVHVVESGTDRGNFGNYVTGDTLKITLDDGLVQYWKNSTFLFQSTLTPSNPLFVDLNIKDDAGTIENVTIGNLTEGSFVAFPSFLGTNPSFQWEFNGASAGSDQDSYVNNTIVVGDEIGCTFSHEVSACSSPSGDSPLIVIEDAGLEEYGQFTISAIINPSACMSANEEVIWTDLTQIGVTSQNNIMTGSISGQAGAASSNVVGENGSVFHETAASDQEYYVGLSTVNTDAMSNSLDFAFRIHDDHIHIEEGGSNLGNYGNFNIGDTLQIEATATTVNYYLNSTLLYSSLLTPVLPLIVDVNIKDDNITLGDIWIENYLCGFQAVYSNMGANPVIDWNVNGVSQGVNSTTFYPSNPTDAASITATIYPDLAVSCSHESNAVTVNVPSFTCNASGASANASPGLCLASVSVPAPTWTSECGTVTYYNDYNNTSDASDDYPVGTTTVNWYFSNGCVEIGTCSVDVVVTDDQAPVITCAADISQGTDAGLCSGTVTVSSPAVSDNCGVASIVNDFNGTADASGTYPVGTTVVTWTATDIYGNTSSCTQNITVADDEDPVVVCPGPQTVNGNASCEGTVSAAVWASATTSDNCDSSLDLTMSPVAGTSFTGTITVTLFATDDAGNVGSCTYDLTVEDVTDPTITCSGDITQNTDPGSCLANVTVTAPVTNDNCLVASVSNDFNGTANASGAYPVGTTVVTWTVTDAAGNSATCSQNVTISDVAPPLITCPMDIIQDADPGMCEAMVTVPSPSVSDNCTVLSVVNDHTGTANASGTYSIGTTTITWTATDTNGNTSSCTQTVTVEDNEDPVITCPADIIVNNDPGTCGAVVTFADASVTDNCPGSSYFLSGGFPSGSTFPVGSIVVSYSAMDAAGNSASCSFTVTVQDVEIPTISCPSDIVVNTDSGMCTAQVNYTTPVGNDNCPGSTTTLLSGLPSGADFPLGTTLVEFEVSDGSGNSATCSFNVTVEDNEAPVVTCPADINLNNDPGICGAAVNYPLPAIIDNCGGSTSTLISGLASGDIFPLGITTVVYEITDAGGYTETCSFDVEIVDAEAPIALCADASFDLGADGSVTIVAAQIDGGSTDNCGIASISISQDTFTSTGDYPVTLTVVDDAGNVSDCVSTVTITDNNAPEVVCQDITVYLDADGEVQIQGEDLDGGSTDNGTIVSYEAIPDLFTCDDLGANNTTMVVTDDGGNSSNCISIVTVLDTIAPNAVCQDILVIVGWDGSASYITADMVDGGSTDNCAVDAISIDIDSFTDADIGENDVSLTVTDNSGNESTCIAVVTVQMAESIPDAIDDYVSVNEDESGVFDVLNNDFDPDNIIDLTTLQIIQSPSEGIASVNPDGTINYAPRDDYNGPDLLTYSICGINGTCDTANVFITVIPVNDGVYAIHDINNTLIDHPVEGNVLTNDSDPDGDSYVLTSVLVAQPSNGSVILNPDGTYIYTPNSAFIGEDQFAYEICDNGNPQMCSTGVVYLEVFTNNFGTNDAPIANPDVYLTDVNTLISSSLISNDDDCENNALNVSYTPVIPPAHGTLVINLNGTFTYQPEDGYLGTDFFEYALCDLGEGGVCDTSRVFFQFVDPMGDPDLNDAPFACDDAIIGNEDVEVIGQLLENDLDRNGDDLNLELTPIVDVQFGVLVINTDGSFSYVPNQPDWNGTDSFVYRICDAEGLCDVATCYITVVPENDPLEIVQANEVNEVDEVFEDDSALATFEDTSLEICLSIEDIDGAGVNIDWANQNAQNGNVQDNTNPTDTCLTYTPLAGFNGVDTLQIVVCDDFGLCDTAIVIVNVIPVNDPPFGVEDFVTTDDQTEIDIPVLDNDSDVEGDNLSIDAVTDPDNGVVIINMDGTITYIPDFGFCGTDSFYYTVCDDGEPMECVDVLVTIEVYPADSDGDGLPDYYETLEADTDNDGTPDYLDTDSDNDGILDELEAQVDNSDPCNIIVVDLDGDLIPNHLDDDSDNDGISDEEEGTEDCDQDGIPNYLDADSCFNELVIPEGFSPNGDGIADTWVIEGLLELYPLAKVKIFDRWGGEVYQADPYENDWDGIGNLNGSGNLPTGTYFYVLELNDDTAPIQGYVYVSKK